MTISSTSSQAGPFVGNGAVSQYPFEFKVFRLDDVQVVTASPVGVEAQLTRPFGFTVTLNTDQNASPGGTVNLPAPLPDGHRIVITSAVPMTQGTDIINQGGFYPEVVEDALDRLTILVQQVSARVSRAAVLPITSTATAEDLIAAIIQVQAQAPSIQEVGNNIDAVVTVAANIDAIVAASDFAGPYSFLTGPQEAGIIVEHLGGLWFLLQDVEDITLVPPSISEPALWFPFQGEALSGQVGELTTRVTALESQVTALLAVVERPGTRMMWPGDDAPSGWFVEDGQAISRSANPGLFAVIGTKYGDGNGSTTFNLANLVTGNRFVRAAGGSLAVGDVQENQNREHTHTGTASSAGNHSHAGTRLGRRINNPSNPVGNYDVTSASSTGSAGAHTHNLAIDSSGGSEARPNSIAMLPIIKGG